MFLQVSLCVRAIITLVTMVTISTVTNGSGGGISSMDIDSGDGERTDPESEKDLNGMS